MYWWFTKKRTNAVAAFILLGLVTVAMTAEESSSVFTEDSVLQAFPSELYHSSLEPFTSFPCLPKRLHLAQATNVISSAVSMTVSFSLDFDTCRNGKPVVLYGKGIKPLGSIEAHDALQFNYTSAYTWFSRKGIYTSDWIYHVQLPDLQAGLVKHWYRIIVLQGASTVLGHQRSVQRSLRGSGGYYLGETKTYTFLTPPLPGSPTSLALVGDLGQTKNSARTLLDVYKATEAANEGEPPVSQLLIAGDMSYADSNPARWTSWMELVEPLVRSTPMHVAAGNHEIECDTKTRRIFVPYEHWFRNPNRIAKPEMEPITEEYKDTLWNHSCSAPSSFQGVYDFGNSFYSYQHGLVHIVVLNSYSDCRVDSPQYNWLEEELRDRFDRNKTPWLLVSFHSPLYTTFLGHVNEVQTVRMQAAMEPLFIKYGVNLGVAGHDHAYLRTTSLARGKVDPTGKSPVYLTLGAGGNREGHNQGFRTDNPEAWVAKRTLQDFGYGHLFVANATHARFQWVRDQTTDNDFEDIVWFKNAHAIA